MIVRAKVKGRIQPVECLDAKCKSRWCFSPEYTVHTSKGGYSGNWQSKTLSCAYRDYHGCPDNADEKGGCK